MNSTCLSVKSFLALAVCLVASVVVIEAQTRDKYLISAKAGGINFVTGNVTVLRKGTKTEEAVTDEDNLESGDVVTTGAGGRVEVLLNPGSYMRVAENSEFEMTNTSLDHLRVRLLKGSAIIEVVGTDDAKLWLEVLTPQTTATIVRRGIYRFNVLQSGTTEVLVRKGRALVGPSAQIVKSGKMITVGRTSASEVAKIERRAQDSLELWSRERAEYLASLNRSMRPAASMIDFSADLFPVNDRGNGRWAYDRGRGCYVFMPGRGGTSSPYGYNYPNRCCTQGGGPGAPPANSPLPVQGPANGGTPVGGGPAPSEAPPVSPSGEDRPRPPRDPGSGRSFRPRGGGREQGEIPDRPEPSAPLNSPQPSMPTSRTEPSEPSSRPEPAQSSPAPSEPVSRPDPAPSYSPPPSEPAPSAPAPSAPAPAPSEAPSRMEAPVRNENPN